MTARSHRARLRLMALYLAVFFGVGFVLSALTGTVALFRLNIYAFSPDPEHRAELHRALHGPALLTLGGAATLHLLVFAALGRRAGYRGARILQLLIPLHNYVVMRRIMWRWTDIDNWQVPAAPKNVEGHPAATFLPRQYVVPTYGAPAVAAEEPVYRLPAGYVPVDVTPMGRACDITPGGYLEAARRFR